MTKLITSDYEWLSPTFGLFFDTRDIMRNEWGLGKDDVCELLECDDLPVLMVHSPGHADSIQLAETQLKEIVKEFNLQSFKIKMIESNRYTDWFNLLLEEAH